MRAFKGKFTKKNGEVREMVFAKLTDLPKSFLDNYISGLGSEKNLPDYMETVWDLEADAFRTFNWAATLEVPEELTISEDGFV